MGKAFFGGGKVGMKKPTTSRLPNGYKELAYIQSSGTQYINTELYATQNTKVVAEAEFLSDTVGDYPMLCGAYTSGTSQFAIFYYGGKWQSWFGSWANSFAGDYKGLNTFQLDSSKFAVSDNSLSVSSGNFTTTYPVTIFAMNQSPTQYYHSSIKLHSMQFYDNGTLVRDFVPCISDAEGIGLFDLVTNKFYGNASGTGSFVGSEVAA